MGYNRTLMQPSLSLSCAEMHAAAKKLAAEHGIPCADASSVEEEVASRIVSSMGERSDGSRGLALGLPQDVDADSVVRMYAEEHVLGGEDE